MMTWTRNRTITIAMLIGVALALIGWDIYAAASPEKGDTISEIFLFFAAHPILPFAFGVLAGHLLWPQSRRPGEGPDKNSVP